MFHIASCLCEAKWSDMVLYLIQSFAHPRHDADEFGDQASQIRVC